MTAHQAAPGQAAADQLAAIAAALTAIEADIAAGRPVTLTAVTADIEDFCKVYPEKIIGLALVGPNETNSSAFEIIGERVLIINSEHGPTKTAANDFKKDIC